jgi:hypothetical protein
MIDIFVPANDDGIGDIQTLTIGRVSNDNRANGMCRRFGCLSEGRALAMPGRRDRAGLILRIDSWSMQLSFYFDDDCPVLRFAWLAHHFLILILRWCINSACCRGCHGVEPNRRGNRKSADVP